MPLLVFFSLGQLYAQQKETISAGIFGEANTYTRDIRKGMIPLMAGAVADYGFTDRVAAGLRAGYGTEFYDVSVFEAFAFGRYYFLNTPFGKPLFVQLGGGIALLMEDDRRVPAPLGDVSAGIRFSLKEKFYIEPFIRGAWPAGFGMGIVAGYRFQIKRRVNTAPDDGTTILASDDVEETEHGIVYVPVIFFRANNADFIGRDIDPVRGLDEQTIASNNAALQLLADFMQNNPAYTVRIEGHANPVLGTQREHEDLLLPLSRARAEFIKQELLLLGVDSARITTVGRGGGEAQSHSGWQNRRVLFYLERLEQK
ncbi:MAG: OmpA family protein [Treponema sp.]|nr:OmpA family protein [Treponema sp.]